MTTILIADDHPLFREALRHAVTRVMPDAVLHEAEDVAALHALIDAEPDADLLLLDLNMPGAQGFGALVHLRALHPELPVVMVSAREEATVIARAIAHGAAGFVPKSSDAATIGRALKQVIAGERWIPADLGAGVAVEPEERDIAQRLAGLTPQQFRVVQMLATGLMNKQIAAELRISEATVKAHMTAILRKLGVNSRTQAVLVAGRLAVDPERVTAPPQEAD